jgi:hypothetical protein
MHQKQPPAKVAWARPAAGDAARAGTCAARTAAIARPETIIAM